MGIDVFADDGLSIAAVIALKPVLLAKTRLSGASGELRSRLALAMALDVTRALSAAIPNVIVVSDEPQLGPHLLRVGITARVLADPTTSGGTTGLNEALEHGAAIADSDIVVAAVADLPCLRSADVAIVLEEVVSTTHSGNPRRSPRAPRRWFCPDLSETGTTMLVARCTRLRPMFEGASATRHQRSGALKLTLPATARRDVDTPADLRSAADLGLGPHTSELLAKSALADFFSC